MTIKQAKEEIKYAMSAYFTKDEFENYAVSVEKQRPVFLVGAPGIGKTAIMEQIAHEIGVGLISYSMTHHTRETMLGLPYAKKKHYDGNTYEVSEYSMSEIISSVYEFMEATDIKEGILLIDEINCVSESLAPVLLQFLQYKVFGKHRVPDGWIIVSAGNPPKYNDSVREFDIAILDRLRRYEVEEDYGVWKDFAIDHRVHPSVLSYLDLYQKDFYNVGVTETDRLVVTARSWDDLATMLTIYAQQKLPINKVLIRQFLQHDRISANFEEHYDMFNKCVEDYPITQILSGDYKDCVESGKSANRIEKYMLKSLMLDSIYALTQEITAEEKVMAEIVTFLRSIRERLLDHEVKAVDVVNMEIFRNENKLKLAAIHGHLSKKSTRITQGIIKVLQVQVRKLYATGVYAGEESFEIIKTDYDTRLVEMVMNIKKIKSNLENMLTFAEEVFKSEGVHFVTAEMPFNKSCMLFIEKHGCKKYSELIEVK